MFERARSTVSGRAYALVCVHVHVCVFLRVPLPGWLQAMALATGARRRIYLAGFDCIATVPKIWPVKQGVFLLLSCAWTTKL